MSDDSNRFDGLGERLEGGGDGAAEADAESESEAADGDDRGGDAADGRDRSDPAFGFDETSKQSVYPLPETWQDVQAALSAADAELRQEHDLHGVEGRELHDAALRALAERPERIAELVAEAREVEADDE